MKELTIEEKAKAYDRALDVLHKYDGAPIMFTEDLKEEMFPELKKNSDEEIRKALIDGFTVMKESKNCGKTFSNHNILVTDILNWLERQDSHYTFEIKMGHWYKCVCDYMINGSDLMFKNGRLYYCRSDWRLAGEIDERNVKAIGLDGYKSFFRPATNQEIKIWLERQGEQKPAETQADNWGEEDEKISNKIVSSMGAAATGFPQDEAFVYKVDNWLQSIKDRVQRN